MKRFALAAGLLFGAASCGELVTLGSETSAIVLVSPVSSPTFDDEDPSFTADETELYFMSDRGGTPDIWVSRRASSADPWGAPTRVDELSTASIDVEPSVTSDGLAMWFSSDRTGGTGLDIWTTTRSSRADPWGTPVRVDELATTSDDDGPTVDATRLVMVFASTRPGGAGLHDLYRTTRASTSDPWQTPVPLTELNTAGQDRDPFASDDGLQIFFATDTIQRGLLAVNWATRESVDVPFGTPVPLDIGRSTYDPALSPSLHHMMFASSRLGTHDIFEFWR